MGSCWTRNKTFTSAQGNCYEAKYVRVYVRVSIIPNVSTAVVRSSVCVSVPWECTDHRTPDKHLATLTDEQTDRNLSVLRPERYEEPRFNLSRLFDACYRVRYATR